MTVGRLLKAAGYGLQGNAKTDDVLTPRLADLHLESGLAQPGLEREGALSARPVLLRVGERRDPAAGQRARSVGLLGCKERGDAGADHADWVAGTERGFQTGFDAGA